MFFCVLFLLLEIDPAQAADISSPAAATERAESRPVPRPSYKRYRGNSRTRSKRMGYFRRRALRRKAMRKKKAAPASRKGVISVDAPKGTMPKK